MNRKLSALVIVILALAMGTTSPRTQSRADVPQALVDRTAAGEEISVIVGVAARFVPEGDLPGADAVAAQRRSIGQAVADTMARAAAVGVRVGASFESLPFFTARVNRAQLEALATTVGVTQIGEDEKMFPTLSVSPGIVNAPPAWTAGFTGAGVGVAVLDTGVDTAHTFFGGRIGSQACYSNALGLGDPLTSSVCPGGVNSDTSGGGPCPANVDGCNHGTHVAGIVAGSGGPGGENGIAPAASIHAIQVFSQYNSPTDCSPSPSPCTTAYTSDIIRGLTRVFNLKNAGSPIASVNMSLGGGLFAGANCDGANTSITATKAAIDNLLSVGVASVIASGNDSAGFAISSPACISTAVAVGATTRGVCPGSPLCPSGAAPGLPNVPVFSNHSIAVDLLAPGVGINSSVPGGGFSAFNGTSMATPHVAGAWAVLKQAAPAATPLQVATALAATGTSITEPFTGIPKPLINVNAARLALLGALGGGSAPGAPGNFAVVVNGNNLSMSWTAPPVSDLIGPAAGAATNYNLIARLVSGGAPVIVLPLGNVTSYGVAAPNGVYFLSVQGTNASGAGPESNVVQVSVPSLPAAPGAPTGLLVNAVGDSATFTWNAPASGGPVANYLLQAGNGPGATIVQVPLGPAPTSFAVGGIPPGTWFVRVLAQNAGGTSAASNEVQFTVIGPQPPGAPTLNTPGVVGNSVSLSWAAGTGGAPVSYTLLASATSGGAPFLSVPGLTGTAIGFNGVPSGTYFLRLVAVNALGSSPPSNEVTLVVP